MLKLPNISLLCLLSSMISTNVLADDSTVSTTTVNPQTNETTTMTVNPQTNASTTTTVNPATQQTTITKSNPITNQTTTTIITPTPAPQVVETTPAGYQNCFTVDAGWYKDVWVPTHTVCQYTSAPQGVAWVTGHWVCTKYTQADQACTKWEWKAGRWAKTFEVY